MRPDRGAAGGNKKRASRYLLFITKNSYSLKSYQRKGMIVRLVYHSSGRVIFCYAFL